MAYLEQASFKAVTHEAINSIHFEFPDGRRLKRAFISDFHILSTAELLDAIQEAGFTKHEVYCIKDDRYTKLPNSMEPTDRVVVSDSWTANIVCYK